MTTVPPSLYNTHCETTHHPPLTHTHTHTNTLTQPLNSDHIRLKRSSSVFFKYLFRLIFLSVFATFMFVILRCLIPSLVALAYTCKNRLTEKKQKKKTRRLQARPPDGQSGDPQSGVAQQARFTHTQVAAVVTRRYVIPCSEGVSSTKTPPFKQRVILPRRAFGFLSTRREELLCSAAPLAPSCRWRRSVSPETQLAAAGDTV